jgi:hypothetical protein
MTTVQLVTRPDNLILHGCSIGDKSGVTRVPKRIGTKNRKKFPVFLSDPASISTRSYRLLRSA